MKLLAAVLFVLAAVPARAAVCAPPTVVDMVTTVTFPKVDPGSSGVQLMTLYRVGNGKARLEEPPDPDNKLHMLEVTNEPDIWMVNRFDHRGRHIVDPSPPFDVHIPVFADGAMDKVFLDLEFGCENEFYAAHAPNVVRNETLKGETFAARAFAAGNTTAELLFDSSSQRPRYARFLRDGRLFSRSATTPMTWACRKRRACSRPRRAWTTRRIVPVNNF
jgi:hypothetical protein